MTEITEERKQELEKESAACWDRLRAIAKEMGGVCTIILFDGESKDKKLTIFPDFKEGSLLINSGDGIAVRFEAVSLFRIMPELQFLSPLVAKKPEKVKEYLLYLQKLLEG